MRLQTCRQAGPIWQAEHVSPTDSFQVKRGPPHPGSTHPPLPPSPDMCQGDSDSFKEGPGVARSSGLPEGLLGAPNLPGEARLKAEIGATVVTRGRLQTPSPSVLSSWEGLLAVAPNLWASRASCKEVDSRASRYQSGCPWGGVAFVLSTWDRISSALEGKGQGQSPEPRPSHFCSPTSFSLPRLLAPPL